MGDAIERFMGVGSFEPGQHRSLVISHAAQIRCCRNPGAKMRVFNLFLGSLPAVLGAGFAGGEIPAVMATTRVTVVHLRHDPVSGIPSAPVLAELRKESSRTGWHCSKASFKIATLRLTAGISGTGHAVRDITATFWHGNGRQIRIFRKAVAVFTASAAVCRILRRQGQSLIIRE